MRWLLIGVLAGCAGHRPAAVVAAPTPEEPKALTVALVGCSMAGIANGPAALVIESDPRLGPMVVAATLVDGRLRAESPGGIGLSGADGYLVVAGVEPTALAWEASRAGISACEVRRAPTARNRATVTGTLPASEADIPEVSGCGGWVQVPGGGDFTLRVDGARTACPIFARAGAGAGWQRQATVTPVASDTVFLGELGFEAELRSWWPEYRPSYRGPVIVQRDGHGMRTGDVVIAVGAVDLTASEQPYRAFRDAMDDCRGLAEVVVERAGKSVQVTQPCL